MRSRPKSINSSRFAEEGFACTSNENLCGRLKKKDNHGNCMNTQSKPWNI